MNNTNPLYQKGQFINHEKRWPLLLIVFFCGACTNEHITLQLTNRSSFIIDSVVIQKEGAKDYIKNIISGQTMTHRINADSINQYHEGAVRFQVYTNGKKYSSYFGWHDWGQFHKKSEHFYLFDDGLRRADIPRSKIAELTIFLYDRCKIKVDSLETPPGALVKKMPSEGYTQIQISYDSFKVNPVIKVHQADSVYNISVTHEWNFEALNQETLFLYDSGRVSKALK